MSGQDVLRVMIVDDEPLARRRIRRVLEAAPAVEITAECGDGAAALAAVTASPPDLLFLDIQMPEMDGFEMLELLPPGVVPEVVFVTAYDQFAMQAFAVHALDYLLKPFDDDRLLAALDHARQRCRERRLAESREKIHALLQQVRPPGAPLKRLLIKEEGRIRVLGVESIDYLEADGSYVKVYAGGECHRLREPLTTLEKRLDPQLFLRLHRSYMVNIKRVKELLPLFKGEYLVVLQNGVRLPLGGAFHKQVFARLQE